MRVIVLTFKEFVVPVMFLLLSHEQTNNGDNGREACDHVSYYGHFRNITRVVPRLLMLVLINDDVVIRCHLVLIIDDSQHEANHGEERHQDIVIAPLVEDLMKLLLLLEKLLSFILKQLLIRRLFGSN